MSVVALIPARKGSRGIPGKNLRTLGGKTLVRLAVECAMEAGAHPVVSTDIPELLVWPPPSDLCDVVPIARPAALAQDDTPMIDVVKHAMMEYPGPPDLIIALLQPTQPFRTPAHIQAAIALLQESGADSVVSVVELPRTHSPEMVCRISEARLQPWIRDSEYGYTWADMPMRRQDADAAFKRDGTVYAFRRRTVERHGHIYGYDVRPLLMAPEDTCELDTEQDWTEVERRWKERHAAPRS